MRALNFGSPTDLKALLTAELAAVGVTDGTQTAITGGWPTGSTYPTLTQIETAENATRALFDTARSAAVVTERTADAGAVATVNKSWDALCGFQNFFDSVRHFVIGS